MLQYHPRGKGWPDEEAEVKARQKNSEGGTESGTQPGPYARVSWARAEARRSKEVAECSRNTDGVIDNCRRAL